MVTASAAGWARTRAEKTDAITAPIRRRHIDRESGRALEILGHAIEYLADEYAFAGSSLFSGDAQVEAIQMLMAVNRQVYFDCPVVPSLGDRFRALVESLVGQPRRED